MAMVLYPWLVHPEILYETPRCSSPQQTSLMSWCILSGTLLDEFFLALRVPTKCSAYIDSSTGSSFVAADPAPELVCFIRHNVMAQLFFLVW